MKIIRAGADHVTDWISMRSALWPDCAYEDHKKETVEALAHQESMPVWLAVTEHDKAVGFIEVSTRVNEEGFRSARIPYIEGWFVKEDYRRRGIGALLVRAVQEWALEKGINEVGSDAASDNKISILAHQRLGFSILKKDALEVKFRWTIDGTGESK